LLPDLDARWFRGYFDGVKELKISIDDEVYHRAKRAVTDLESALSQHVTEYLNSLNGDDEWCQSFILGSLGSHDDNGYRQIS
jgi:hypothetical protein